MSEHVEIKIINEGNAEDIINLYIEAEWWEPSFSPRFVENVVKNSFCFAGAFLENKMIGMGRALSDGVSDAYIQDVTVLKKYRGQGIGAQIITTITEHLKEKGIDWIGLIGQPGTEGFYRKLGFKVMKDHIPMRLE